MAVEAPSVYAALAGRRTNWAAQWVAVALEWLRANPGWIASAVLHLAMAIVLSLMLLNAPRDRAGIGIEGSLSDGGGGGGDLESILGDAGAVEISSAPVTSSEAAAAALLAQSSDQAAAAALSQIEGAGLGGSGPGSGGGSGGGDGTGNGPGLGAGFFGAKGEGRSFVFVVDMSGSMQGDRFRRATGELAASVNKLKPEQSFYIFFFNDRTYPLYDPKPASGLQPATPTNKTRAVRWIRSRQPSRTTDPSMALLRALEMKPNVIFFLTDGELDDPSGVRSMIREHNRSGVTIHTIAFENPEGAQTLEAIARENKGEFRFVK